MKSSKHQNLCMILIGALATVILAGLLVSCAQAGVRAPNASQSTPQTMATTTSQVTATLETAQPTVTTGLAVTAEATVTSTTEVTPTTATSTTVAATSAVTNTQVATPTMGVTATETTTATGATTSTSSSAVTAQEKYKDLPVGFTKEGFPYRGSLDAPIVMVEYSDYQCPFCSRYFTTTEPVIDESYVRSGKIRVIFRDFPLVQLHPNAPAAANAANCVAAQGATKFWTMHDALFQPRVSGQIYLTPKLILPN